MNKLLTSSAIAALALAGAAHAATFTDEGTFLGANTITLTEGFSEFSDSTTSLAGPFTTTSGITVSSETNDLFIVGTGQSTNPSVAIGSNFPRTDTLTVALGGLFSAFGLDIFQNDGAGNQLGGGSEFTITAFNGMTVVDTFTATVDPDGGSFFGFNTAGMFDSVNIASDDGLFEVIDNVAAGVAGVSAVPLPASLPLLLAGFGALGIARRRKS